MAHARSAVTVHDDTALRLVRLLHDDPKILAGEDRPQHVRALRRGTAGHEDLDPVDAGLHLLPDEAPNLGGTIDLPSQEPAWTARDRQRHARDQDMRSTNEPIGDGSAQLHVDVTSRAAIAQRRDA